MVSTDKTKNTASRQQFLLPLTLPSHRPKSFISSRASESAQSRLAAWQADLSQSSGLGIVISGPPGSGKSFLLATFADQIGGQLLLKEDLPQWLDADQLRLTSQPVLLDDADHIADPTDLFRFINTCLEVQRPFVICGRSPKRDWAINAQGGALTDLETRLSALPEARLEPPDSAFMIAVLQQELAGRQIILDHSLAKFGVERLRRSLPSVLALADHLDTESMQQQKTIDKTLIAEVTALIPEHML